MKNCTLAILCFFITYSALYSQKCQPDEILLTINLLTDEYPEETTIIINTFDGEDLFRSPNYEGQVNTNIIEEVCLPADVCLNISVLDSYGDGICCDYGVGNINVTLDGKSILMASDFGSIAEASFNCSNGQICTNAIDVALDVVNTSPDALRWHSFSPTESAQYRINPCLNNNNDCEVDFLILENCVNVFGKNGVPDVVQEFYDVCNSSEELTVNLYQNNTYYFLTLKDDDSCVSKAIDWSLSLEGPINNSSGTTIQVGNTILTERIVTTGTDVPWEILWGPDDHIWITERRGQVLRLNPTNSNITTILDIRDNVNSDGEPGLLGMALHPDFENTPLVYMVYNYTSGGFNIKERLVSYEWNGTSLSNETIIMNDIDGGGIHNGSRLVISPDEKILMTTGDTGNGNLSQNLSRINGKLLRINLDGSVPEDNPIPDSYIYSFGHRNAQGLAYGPNGQLYASEHGAQQSDEFNLILENRNYGWPNVQGACNTNTEQSFCNANNVVEPLIEWSPCVAVNDIIYYDHPAIPEWSGKMLMAVLGGFVQNPRLSVLSFNEDGTAVTGEQMFFNDYGRIRDICINPNNGAIFFATNGSNYPGSGPNEIVEYRNLNYGLADCIEDPNRTIFYRHNNQDYLIVQDLVTWERAAACASQSGGKLIEVNDQAEQDALFEALNDADLNLSNLVAPDGGGAAYVWLGGNDLNTEGTWVWDGTNAGKGIGFWQGDSNGTPLNDSYNNWGTEPDDFNGQDGLAIGMTPWVFGEAGNWNDIDHENMINYVIEYTGDPISSTQDLTQTLQAQLAPNPFSERTTLRFPNPNDEVMYLRILDSKGANIKLMKVEGKEVVIDRQNIPNGVYYYELKGSSGKTSGKFIIQ